jgi:hypothetical protein
MKTKTILLVISLIFNLATIQAQVIRTINVAAAGTLSTLLGNDKTTITDLTLTGTINDADFATIKQMSALKDLNMASVNIVNGAIPNNAFQNMVLNKIVFPSSLTSIGLSAFNGMTIPSLDFSTCPNLQSIGNNAFNGIKLGNNRIDLSALDRVSLEGNWNGGPFSNCSAEVILSNNKTTIEACAFKYFYGSVNMPSSLLTIGNEVFSGASPTNDIILPEGLTTIGNDVFKSATIKRIVFPSSLTSIGISAFNGMTISSLDFSTCPKIGRAHV